MYSTAIQDRTVEQMDIKAMELSNKLLTKTGLAIALLGAIAFDLGALPVKAQMHGMMSHPSKAEIEQLSALDDKQLSANRLFNEGLEKLRIADDQGAIENFSQAIALSPRLEDAYVNRGNVYRKLGNHQGAIADYTQALQLNPSFTYLYNSRGNVREDLQDYKGAIADYTEAIRLYPEQSDGYRNLGSAYYKLGDYQAALKSLNQAVQVNSGSAASYLKRGEIYVKLDDHEKGINDFQQATDLFSSQGNVENSKKASQLLQELQKQHPDQKTAR